MAQSPFLIRSLVICTVGLLAQVTSVSVRAQGTPTLTWAMGADVLTFLNATGTVVDPLLPAVQQQTRKNSGVYTSLALALPVTGGAWAADQAGYSTVNAAGGWAWQFQSTGNGQGHSLTVEGLTVDLGRRAIDAWVVGSASGPAQRLTMWTFDAVQVSPAGTPGAGGAVSSVVSGVTLTEAGRQLVAAQLDPDFLTQGAALTARAGDWGALTFNVALATSATTVPEPAAISLFALGGLGLWGLVRRRPRAASAGAGARASHPGCCAPGHRL
ncbi:MAG: hypothetical protein RI907_2410 [Pseudomonadota bacterium]|jgi:hypothetical protein